MSVPELVNALCHHLAARNDHPCTNFASTNKSVRDTLYKRYRDVAFSELLGLGTGVSRRRGTGWDEAETEQIGNGTSKRPGTSRTLDSLRERLVVGNSGDAVRARALRSVVVAETDGGFVFSATEGERVYRFLELLATTWPEDDEEEELRVRRDALAAHVGRGVLVDDPPNAAFVPGLVALRDVVEGADTIRLGGDLGYDGGDYRRMIPAARGWFDERRNGEAHRSPRRGTDRTPNVSQEHTPMTTPRTERLMQAKPFAYQPSKSPVKVPIGSLFMDSSPGKMTAFDARSASCREEPATGRLQWDQASQDVLKPLELGMSDFGAGTLMVVNRDLLELPRVRKEAVTLWNGEESEIAREALLALGGVRSSLSKLRGRLMMPQALPRPASAHILSSMVEVASARYLVEDFVMPILKGRDTERSNDPICRSFAHGLKHVMDEIDKELVEVEIEGVNSWMQPVGLKMGAGVDAWGAEYHGMGMSILQLAHATDKARTSLLFLASYFGDRDRSEDGGWFPLGQTLLERLYETAQHWAEGEQADISKRLFLRALAPYLSLVSRWVYCIEPLTYLDPFVAPLSSEFSMVALGKTLGPAYVPSFFSARMRRDLMVAGTQIRLLYAWRHGDMGEGLGAGVEWSGVFEDEVAEQGAEKTRASARWFTSGPSPEDLEITNAYMGKSDDGYSQQASPEPVADADLPSVLSSSAAPAPRPAAPTRRAHFQHVLDSEATTESITVLMESYIGGMLRTQASLVSRACVHLFADQQQLHTLDVIRFLRNALMGVAGDFTSELVRSLDASILELEPMTALKARAAVFAASSNSCLKDSPFATHLTANLLPEGENAVSLVEDAFNYSIEYSDVTRIKAPYISSMAPVLVPPVGHAAYDCIHVSFLPPGLLGTIISEDTMTAYSAILSMNVRLRRAILALEATNRATMMGRHEKMKCARGDFQLPWAERFKTFRAFCLTCSLHLNAVAQMYLACCTGADWQAVELALSIDPRERDIDPSMEASDIHSLIKIHKRFAYRAASRILSACDAPSLKLGIEMMTDAVLDLRNTVDNAGRRRDAPHGGRGHVQRIFEDITTWQEIKRLMLMYERGRVGALQLKKSWKNLGPALDETEKIRNNCISALDT